MDPQIALEGQADQRLSRIVANAQARRRYLSSYWGRDDAVFCQCQPQQAVAMGVARRRIPEELFYLYPLHHGDGALHVPACPHYQSEIMHGRAGRAPAHEPASTSIDVSLRSPAEAPNTDLGHVPRERELLPLLETLWHAADLHRWHPGFKGKRQYGLVQHRITQSAADISVNAKPLATYFLMPPPYNPRRQRECDQALDDFLDALMPSDGSQGHEGFICGRIKQLERKDKRATIQLAHLALKLRLSDAALDDYERCWDLEANSSIVLVRVTATRWRPRPGAPERVLINVHDMAALKLADDVSWIPVAGDEQQALCRTLVDEDRHFERPLPCAADALPTDLSTVPAFWLMDTAEPMALEVLTAMHDQSYAYRALERRQARSAPAWWWDNRWPMPEIPAADDSD